MLENIFVYGAIPANAEKGTYIPLLVLASYIVASFGSYAGLTLATQIFRAETKQKKRILHWTGAFALGVGIWSMHFIGMLAYKMRMTVYYDPFLTALSLLIAVMISYAALQITQTGKLSLQRIVGSAVLLGIGICAMHYTGMAAMQMRADLRYTPPLFFLSVAVAIIASGAALWIIFTLGRHSGRWKTGWMIIAAMIMGIAICGMHYTGMAAAIFIPFADCRFNANQSFQFLAVAVIASSTILLTVLTFAISRRLFLIVGCGALFALPLVIIVYQAITELNSNISIAQKEQYGARYHNQLLDLLQRVQETRGLTNVVRNGDVALVDKLQSKKEETRQMIATVDEVDKSSGHALAVNQDWQSIKSKTLSLLDAPGTQASNEVFKQYSEIVDSLTDFMEKLADKSGLSTNPQLDSDYLADVSIHVTPKIMETIGRMRGLTVGLLASGRLPQQWAQEEIRQLQIVEDTLNVQDNDIRGSLERAKHANESSGQFIEYHDQTIEPSLEKLQKQFEQIIFTRASDLSDADIFALATDTIALYDNLYDKTSDAFLDLLKQRQEEYVFKRNLVLYSSTAAFLGFIVLFVFLYRALARTERAEQAILQAKLQTEQEAYTIKLLRSVATTANTASNIEEAIEKCLELVCEFMQWPIGHAYIWDYPQNKLLPTNLWHVDDRQHFKTLMGVTASTKLASGKGLPGRVWEKRAPAWIADLSHDPNFPRGKLAADLGVKAGFAFPIILGNAAPYILEFFFSQVTSESEELLNIMKDIGNQLAQVIVRTQAQNALREAKDVAEKATAVKSDFLANMSHELRTPLNSILGMNRLLLESDLTEEQQGLADTVFRSSVSLLEIVNDILDLSKIEAGEMELEHIGSDPKYVLDSVVHSLGQIAREKRIPIVRHYKEENFPYILGDPVRLNRVFTNLIGNAIKYTDEGHVDVRVSCKMLGDKQVEFHCEITDTGIGIPQEKLASIFEKFVQADTSITRKYGGTGLGLAITRQLVELMGGKIGVESEVGKGSTFWFTILFEITDKLHEEKRVRQQKSLLGTIPPEKARILIAEDHPMNQILMTKLMKRFNIGSFEIVEDGVDALKRYNETPWDVILMDCHMPEKNGYDTTEEIRDLEKGTAIHVPIVAMTANAMVGDREKCLRYGMDEYISKPINIDELKEVLSQWVCFKDMTTNGKNDQPTSRINTPLDLSLLRTFTDGDAEMEQQLIRAFVDQSDKNLKVLAENSTNTGAKAWHDTAHMFKGGASGVGANVLAELCRQAQHFEGTAQEQAALYEKISGEYTKVKNHLKELGLLA